MATQTNVCCAAELYFKMVKTGDWVFTRVSKIGKKSNGSLTCNYMSRASSTVSLVKVQGPLFYVLHPILAKRTNVRIEDIKHSKSRGSLLKRLKENDQKKEEVKEKDTWVPLKRQAAPPGEVCFVRTNGKEPELLELIPYGLTA
ncbi:large ribosomal subunit protein eL21-like [Rattus norvegicus]|uniref:large ribosomal subunit protein eL21-like n=1 Tax=Rattus norvegicus TaxID=10116 RepID=UPI002FD80F73